MEALNETSMADAMPDVPSNMQWCFDLLLYYESNGEDDEQSRHLLAQLRAYTKFSYVINGIITSALVSFGLLGNGALVYQIRKSRHFSRRLACHLSMLCLWDSALLGSCLFTYCISAFQHGIVPIFGTIAYLLYFLQPVASLSVQAGIWQVCVITIERYLAVARPLEQRTRNAQFSVRTICATIAAGAFILNMAAVPFERKLSACYEVTQTGAVENTMIMPEDHVNNQYYAIFVHLLPDIIFRYLKARILLCINTLLTFRAPTPIVLISILTIRTLIICSRRTVGAQIINARRNIPYMLTLLNIKFVLCNTLYLFNTVLMEVMGYGGKTSSQQTLEMEEYVRSLYLTDFSNMLLALHSATNWLVFYNWPKWTRNRKYLTLNVSTSDLNPRLTPLDRDLSEYLLTNFLAHKFRISADILLALCRQTPPIASCLLGSAGATSVAAPAAAAADEEEAVPKMSRASADSADARFAQLERQKSDHDALQTHAVKLASIIEEILFALANKSVSLAEWRELCRQIGYRYHEVNFYCGADQWKRVRDVLVASMSAHGNKRVNAKTPRADSNLLIKVFNYALCEMKSGALCAIVDVSRQHVRASKAADGSCTLSARGSPSTTIYPVTAYTLQRSTAKTSSVWPHCESHAAAHSLLDFSTLESPPYGANRTFWQKLRRLQSLTTEYSTTSTAKS